MIKKIIVVFLSTIAILLTLIVIKEVSIVVAEKLNRNRCYNLPLNDFYNDKTCLQYKENLDE